MFDDRKAMASETTLKLDNHNQYTITEEIGRGASCIVYGASYRDAAGHDHLVRVKECYPYDLEIIRTPEGALKASPSCQEKFCREQERFKEAYAKNVRLKNTLGLMNSTVDAVNLFSCNHTWYSVMTCLEGRDYRRDEDPDLQSLFTRILALARIIKKYHDNGVLHLDIKPENIFLIPETKEHMILFDFDSMIEKEELKSGSAVRISFSDGYSAPELAQGNKNKISEAADIFSIGAVVFYKLFGRTPNALDGAVGVTYDFELMKKRDVRYQPQLFRKLSVFLHKTIASSPAFRYKNMDEIIPVLEDLINMSDIESAFLFHNFSYHFASFISREEELEEIRETFDSGCQILFLSGIGGIGKTELAKRYACDNSRKYRKIVFVPFAGSVSETLCRDDIRINGIEQGENEENREYFERKLQVLRTVTSQEDLVILDNFDVESDDDLEALFECPCKFLVTSREDFRDYGYEQLSVGKIADMDALLKLFEIYNRKEYHGEEEKCIKDMIEMVDGHTMTVELMAKYLRATDDTPQAVLKNLMKKEGITSTAQIKVKHRKDRNLRAESINSHLLTLFDLSCFTEGERELIKSLSLLGYIRISAERFLEYCPVENGRSALDSLIRRGWMEYDKDRDKISLHQIILDLVYNHLKPTSEDCPEIIKKMTEYLTLDDLGYAERQVRDRLFEEFMKRVKGNDLAYARLCVLYCAKIKIKAKYLDNAKQICLSSKSGETYDILQKIYRLTIRKIKLDDEIFERMLEEEDFDEDAYVREQVEKICGMAEGTYLCGKKYSKDPAYLGRFCLELAYDLDGVVSNSMILIADDHKDSADRILDMAAALIDDAENYLLDAEMDISEKKRLFGKMKEFFNYYDFTNIYRSEKYSDEERIYHYQEILDHMGEPEDCAVYIDNKPVYSPDMNLRELIMAVESKGEYEKAIEIYRRAYVHDSETYEYTREEILEGMGDNYLKLGDQNSALRCYEDALELNRNSEKNSMFFMYSSHTCYKLIRLFMEARKLKEARKYCREMISYNSKKAEEGSSDYDLSWLTAACYLLYKMEDSHEEKQEYWDKSVMYFKKLTGEEELSEELTEFLIELADHEKKEEHKIERAFEYMERSRTWYNAENAVCFLEYILGLCEGKKEYILYHIKALLSYSECLCNSYPGRQEEALTYCKKANDLYEENRLTHEYWYSLIHKRTGECYGLLSGYDYDQVAEEKGKCNYWLLAEIEAEGKSVEKQIRIWKNAADEYEYLDNYPMERDCYEKVFALLTPILNQYDYSSFQNYWSAAESRLLCYEHLHDREQVREKGMDLYCKAVDDYIRESRKAINDEARWQKAWDFGWKVRTCADYLSRSQWEVEASVLYIMAIMVTAAWKDASGEVLAHAREYAKGEWDQLFEAFSSALHDREAGQNVDHVVMVYENVKSVLEGDGRLKRFDDEVKWFLEEYQNREIEFKR